MRKTRPDSKVARLLRRWREDEGGVALLAAIFLSVVGALLMVTGTRMISQSSKETYSQNRVLVEADNAARAGIADALAWFRRQDSVKCDTCNATYPTQWADEPFYPREITTPEPGKTPFPDTLDERVGLVKEYRISSSTQGGLPVWMRYEVRRQEWPRENAMGTPVPTPSTPNPTPDWTPRPWDDNAVHDVTGQRIPLLGYYDGGGDIWQVTGLGYVFTRPDETKAYNEHPNKVLASSAIQTEFRRISINLPTVGGLPAKAAIYTAAPFSNIQLKQASGSVELLGGCNDPENSAYAALSTNSSISAISTSGGARVCGALGVTVKGTGGFSYNQVFGLSLQELKNMADFSVTTPDELFSSGVTNLPAKKLYVIDPAPSGEGGSVSFSKNFHDGNSSLMIVAGNLILNPGSEDAFYFSGILYVTGDLTIYPPCSLSGTVIMANTNSRVYVNPNTETDQATISYGDEWVRKTQQQVAQYRENQGAVRRFSREMIR